MRKAHGLTKLLMTVKPALRWRAFRATRAPLLTLYAVLQVSSISQTTASLRSSLTAHLLSMLGATSQNLAGFQTPCTRKSAHYWTVPFFSICW